MLIYIKNCGGSCKLFCGNRNSIPEIEDWLHLTWAYIIDKWNSVFWVLLCVLCSRKHFRFACSTCSEGLTGDTCCAKKKKNPTSFHPFIVQPGDLFHSLSKNYFLQKEKAQTYLQQLLTCIVPSGVFISVCSYNVTVWSSDYLSYSIVFPEHSIAVVKPTLGLWL